MQQSRATPIEYEDVSAAAKACLQAGERPTLRRVHARLGRGSLSTVSRHLHTWQAAQPLAAPAPALPEGLVKSLTAWLKSELDAARVEASVRVAALEDERSLLEESNSQLEDRQQQLEAQLADAHATVATRDGQLQQQGAQLEALRAELVLRTSEAVEGRTEIAKAQLRLEAVPQLEQQVGQLRSLLDEERRCRAVAEQESAVRQTQGVAAEREAAVAREEVARLSNMLAAATGRLGEMTAALNSSLERSQEDLRAATAQLTQIRRDSPNAAGDSSGSRDPLVAGASPAPSTTTRKPPGGAKSKS